MRVVFDPRQLAHRPQTFIVRGRIARCPDLPERAEVLLAAARDAGHEVVSPEDFGSSPRAAVHTPEYLDFLEHAHAAWRALPDPSDEVVPNVHPSRHMVGRPRAIVGLAGYHMADTACPLTPDTWASACASANTAVQAARLVLAGAPSVYALCRPSGHHAYADMAGGFCYLNNAAIAAQDLRRELARVAVLDVTSMPATAPRASSITAPTCCSCPSMRIPPTSTRSMLATATSAGRDRGWATL